MIRDGCSGGMSWAWRTFLGYPPPWEGCCDIHDDAYAVGGDEWLRLQADYALFQCVCAKGKPGWALIMFMAVRVGGTSFLPFPWRWGFATIASR